MSTPSSCPVLVALQVTFDGQGVPRDIWKKDCAKGACAKVRVDTVEPANHTYSHCLIEDAPLVHKLHSGGSSLNLTCVYDAKDNNSISSEQLRACTDKAQELFKAFESHRRPGTCICNSFLHKACVVCHHK